MQSNSRMYKGRRKESLLSNEEENEVSYHPVTIDYMRDVFRPKVFVKAGSTPSPTKNKLFTSVYEGLNDVQTIKWEEKHRELNYPSNNCSNSVSSANTRRNGIKEDKEEEEAIAYRTKILEIEKK